MENNGIQQEAGANKDGIRARTMGLNELAVFSNEQASEKAHIKQEIENLYQDNVNMRKRLNELEKIVDRTYNQTSEGAAQNQDILDKPTEISEPQFGQQSNIGDVLGQLIGGQQQ